MKIIFKRNDSGVSITNIVKDLSADEVVAHAEYLLTLNPQFISYRVIQDDSLLPADRVFRDAWTDDNATPTVDIRVDKANEIHRNKLRELRQPLMNKLDVDYTRADEVGDKTKKQDIATKKQKLRDITKFDDVQDLEVLKTYKFTDLNT